MRARLSAILAGLILLAVAIPAPAQDVYVPSFMGCAACQMFISNIEPEPGEGDRSIQADLSKPCSILPPQDQKGCIQAGAVYGPKFIKAIRAKRAQGLPPAAICGQMGFCQ